MDVIAWAVGLIAGIAQPSLRIAIIAGTVTSLLIRAYQYFLVEPRTWGHTLPEDFFGATAMLLVTAAFAWLGSLIRQGRTNRRLKLQAEA